jgi:hypothetical protein
MLGGKMPLINYDRGIGGIYKAVIFACMSVLTAVMLWIYG